MFKLVLACAFLASALADVSHLFRPKAFSVHPAPPAFHPTPFAVRPVAAVRAYQPVVTAAVPKSYGHHVGILREINEVHPDGSYQYGFDTENGISVNEQASVRSLGPEQAEKSAQGSYSYTSPEGEVVSISYVADANGFQPQGSHIPVAPPVPAAIQRALDWIAAHPQHSDYSHSVIG